jgi:hypothetical protein
MVPTITGRDFTTPGVTCRSRPSGPANSTTGNQADLRRSGPSGSSISPEALCRWTSRTVAVARKARRLGAGTGDGAGIESLVKIN